MTKKKDYPERACAVCGRAYKPDRSNQVACSPPCLHERRRQLQVQRLLRIRKGLVTESPVNVEAEVIGDLISFYVRLAPLKARKTRRYAGGLVLAHYDGDGNLMGLEVLGSCDATSVPRRLGQEA
jgi:hypothetical protein